MQLETSPPPQPPPPPLLLHNFFDGPSPNPGKSLNEPGRQVTFESGHGTQIATIEMKAVFSFFHKVQLFK